MTSPAPGTSPLHLRDRLYATLTEFNVSEPGQAVEAVCAQFTGWLRTMGEDWYERAVFSGDVGIVMAARNLINGLADGIDAGTPVSPQDPGVS